jgi:DNA-binding CsgD family transcriptional regulator
MLQRLTHDDLELLDDCVQSLFKPALNPVNYIQRTFAILARLIPHDLAIYSRCRRTNDTLEVVFSQPLTGAGAALQAFAAVKHKYPLFNFDPTVNGGAPFRRSDFFTAREFRSLDVFCETFGPLGLDNHCAVHIPTGDGVDHFFSIERSPGADFGDRDRAILGRLQRHVANARLLAHELGLQQPGTPEEYQRHGFTPRECDVLFWLIEGKTNCEIGIILKMKVTTVKTHIQNLMQKMGVENRTSAIRHALQLRRESMDDIAMLDRLNHSIGRFHAGRRFAPAVEE